MVPLQLSKKIHFVWYQTLNLIYPIPLLMHLEQDVVVVF